MRIVTTIILVVLSLAAFADDPNPSGSSVGYKTVQAALDALRAMPGVTINVTKPDGWIIADDRSTDTLWSFTPAGHYAHPAVIKRIIKQDSTGVFIEMSALCENTKPNCDQLVREFEQLNQRIRENVQRKLGGHS
jgi:hypothetical protein